jgi:hypothetical protein
MVEEANEPEVTEKFCAFVTNENRIAAKKSVVILFI